MNEDWNEFQQRMRRAEAWLMLAGALLLLAVMSGCSFRQDLPLGKDGDWGVLYLGYSPPMGRLFRQANKDLPDPPLPSPGKEVVR
jgi:hypothetical protein